MRRTDLNIKNATRIIIKRDKSWKEDSRLYNIEIRWDYDNTFAKYCWNNEKYSLPQVITNKMAHVDTRVLAIACSRSGLMYKTRFEQDTTNDLYLEIWRKDLRDNLEEQRRLSLNSSLGIVTDTKVVKDTNTDSIEINVFDDINSIIETPVTIHNETIIINKVSHETNVIKPNKKIVICDEVPLKEDTTDKKEVFFDFF